MAIINIPRTLSIAQFTIAEWPGVQGKQVLQHVYRPRVTITTRGETAWRGTVAFHKPDDRDAQVYYQLMRGGSQSAKLYLPPDFGPKTGSSSTTTEVTSAPTSGGNFFAVVDNAPGTPQQGDWWTIGDRLYHIEAWDATLRRAQIYPQVAPSAGAAVEHARPYVICRLDARSPVGKSSPFWDKITCDWFEDLDAS